MSKHGWAFLADMVMVIGGLVTYVAFHDIETPVVGLRQAGLVIAVLGRDPGNRVVDDPLEAAADGWSLRVGGGGQVWITITRPVTPTFVPCL